jgi:hypothetical protein
MTRASQRTTDGLTSWTVWKFSGLISSAAGRIVRMMGKTVQSMAHMNEANMVNSLRPHCDSGGILSQPFPPPSSLASTFPELTAGPVAAP